VYDTPARHCKAITALQGYWTGFRGGGNVQGAMTIINCLGPIAVF